MPSVKLWHDHGKTSPLGLDIWFTAIWAIANDKNGISSYEFARMTGITQR